MDGIQSLYNTLTKGKYYTKSIGEFREQMKDPEYRSHVANIMEEDGILSPQMKGLLNLTGVVETEETPELSKKKEQTTVSSLADGSLASQELPDQSEQFDLYAPVRKKETKLPKSFEGIDYSQGIATPAGIKNISGQLKEKLKNANLEDISALGDVMAEKVVKEGAPLTGFSQSSAGKVGDLIKSVQEGIEISPEDEKYLKERSPKAYNELLSWTPQGKVAGKTDVVFEPAASVNDVARNISKTKTENFAKSAYADILQTELQLQSIGIDPDKIGNVSTRNEMMKVQSVYDAQLKKLQEKYPEEMAKTYSGGTGGASPSAVRDKNYYVELKKIDDAKDAIMSGIAKIHAQRYALANPDAPTEVIGEEVLKVIDPTRYSNYLRGGKRSLDVKEDLDKLGYGILQSTGNEQLIERGVSAENNHDKKYPNDIIDETKRRIAVEYMKDHDISSYVYTPRDITISEADKYASQLSAKYRNTYLNTIRPQATTLTNVGAHGDVGNTFQVSPNDAVLSLPPMGGAINELVRGALSPAVGIGKFVQDRLSSDADVVNRALEKGESPIVNRDEVKRQISNIESKPTLTIDDAKELERLKGELSAQSASKAFVDGTFQLTGQVIGQAVLTELGAPVVSGALRGVSLGTKTIGLANKAAQIAELSNKVKSMKDISGSIVAAASSYSDAEKEAINLGLDGWKQGLYATTVAGLNAATERIFPDEKVLKAFNKDVSPLIAKMVKDMSSTEITNAAILGDGIKRIVLDYIPKYAKNMAIENQKEALEEVATQVGTSVMKAILAPDKLNIKDEIDAVKQTWYETTVFGGLTSGLAALKETNKSSITKKTLYELGADPRQVQSFIDVINQKVSDKTMSQAEADMKIKAVTDVQNIVQNSIPAINQRKPLTDAEKIKLTSVLLAERRLKEDIANPQLEDVKSLNQKELAKVTELKDKILNDEVVVDNDLNAYTQDEYNQKVKEDAIQKQTAGKVPVQPTTGVSEKVEEGVSEPKPEIATEKVKKELPEGVTITSAVTEDGEPDYEAEDAVREIAKKRNLGITSDRELSNVARDADGNVIGGAFTSYDGDKYTFDVVVDEAYDGQGLGSNLLDEVKDVPQDIKEQNPDAKVEVDVVNPTMQKMLEARGFEVTRQLGEGRVAMEPSSQIVSSKTPEMLAAMPESVEFVTEEGDKLSSKGNEQVLADLYNSAMQVKEDERTLAQQSAVNAVESMQKAADKAELSKDTIVAHAEEDMTKHEGKAKTQGAKRLLSTANNIVKTLKSMMPNVEVYIHTSKEAYADAVKDISGANAKSAGNFFPGEKGGPKRIDINLEIATPRTLAHEAVHAILSHKFGDNKALFDKFKKSLSTTINSMGSQDFIGDRNKIVSFKKYLKSFVDRYDTDRYRENMGEEYIVELASALIDNAANISVSGWRKVALAVHDFVKKYIGIKLFENLNDTRDIVDFFNSVAKSFREGTEVKIPMTKKISDQVGASATSTTSMAAIPLSEIDVKTIRTQDRPGKRISKGLSIFTRAGKKIVEEAKDLSLDYVKKNAPELFIKNANILASYPLVSGVKKFQSIDTIDQAQEVYDVFINQVSENLKYLMSNFDQKLKDISTLWYDGANILAQNLSEKYGIKKEQVAGIIASLSPQKDWYQNVRLAEMVMMAFKDNPIMTDKMLKKQALIVKEGEKPKLKSIEKARNKYRESRTKKNKENLQAKISAHEAYMKKAEKIIKALSQEKGKSLNDVPAYIKPYIVRLYHEINTTKDYDVLRPDGASMGVAMKKDGVNKAKVAWGSYTEIGKAVSIYLDGSQENITRTLGEMHKIRNFYNNIIDPMSKDADVTMDTHAVAAALLMPLSGKSKQVAQNFGTGTMNSAPFGIKGLYYAFAEGYKKAAEDTGLLPRQVQSVTWEAIRGLFTDVFKRDKTSVAKINNIWNNFENNKIDINEARKQILEVAGGINKPTWASGGRESVQTGVGSDVRERGVGGGRGVSKRFDVGARPGRREGGVSKAQLPPPTSAPRFVRDISVLITPATVRGFDKLTRRISKMSIKYDELVKEYAKSKKDSDRLKIKELEDQILNDVQQELINDISKVPGAAVRFGAPKIGLWEGKFEPSFNMTLSITPQANTEELSNLLNKFGEKYSQDAFILETESELNEKYQNDEIKLPLTQFDENGLSHYPQIIYTFANTINDEKLADISNQLQENGIDAFSLNNNELKISVLTFLSDEQQKLSEDEQYAEKLRVFESTANSAENAVRDAIGNNAIYAGEVIIKKSHYQGAINEGTSEKTRQYNRGDIFKPFQYGQTKVEKLAKEFSQLRKKQINGQKLTSFEKDRFDELEAIVQPVVERTFEANEKIYEQAKKEVESIAEKSIKNFEASISPFPIKRPSRASVKVLRWYNSFTEKLGDGARVNIIVKNDDDADALFNKIDKDNPISNIDRVGLRRINEKTDLGYPKRLIEVRTPSGIISEIQVITEKAYLAKDGMRGFTGDQKQKDSAKKELKNTREQLGWNIPDGLGHYFYEIERDTNVPDELRDEAKRLSNIYYESFVSEKPSLNESPFMDNVMKFKDKVDAEDKSDWDKGNEGKAPDSLTSFTPYAVLEKEQDEKVEKILSKASLGGEKANLTDQQDADKEIAIRLEKLGKNAKEIRWMTGWERGADGKWRYEFDSSTSKLKLEFSKKEDTDKVYKLDDILSFPDLFDAYPTLKDIIVDFDDSMLFGEASYWKGSTNGNEFISLGYDKDVFDTLKDVPSDVINVARLYDKVRAYKDDLERSGMDPYSEAGWKKVKQYERSIGFDQSVLVKNGYATEKDYGMVEYKPKMFFVLYAVRGMDSLNSDSTKSTMLHEIQHAIQRIEGFETGSNYNTAVDLMTKEEKGEYDRLSWEAAKLKTMMRKENKSFTDLTEAEQESYYAAKEFLHQIYKRVGGETEARNVEKRMKMTAKERRSTPLTETEDIPREKQIFRSKAQLADDAEKKKLISKLKKEANKAISKVIESTFDTDIRNKRTLEINKILWDKIKEVEEIGQPKSKAQLTEEEKNYAISEIESGKAGEALQKAVYKLGLALHSTKEGKWDKIDESKIVGGNRAVYGWGVYFTPDRYKYEEFGGRDVNKLVGIKVSDFNFIDTDEKLSSELRSELKNASKDESFSDRDRFIADSILKQDSKYSGTNLDDLMKYFLSEVNLSYEKGVSLFFKKLGYDGFKNANQYVLFNFDKGKVYSDLKLLIEESQPKSKAQLTPEDVSLKKSEDGEWDVMHNGEKLGSIYFDRSLNKAWREANYKPKNAYDIFGDVLGYSKEEAVQEFLNRKNQGYVSKAQLTEEEKKQVNNASEKLKGMFDKLSYKQSHLPPKQIHLRMTPEQIAQSVIDVFSKTFDAGENTSSILEQAVIKFKKKVGIKIEVSPTHRRIFGETLDKETVSNMASLLDQIKRDVLASKEGALATVDSIKKILWMISGHQDLFTRADYEKIIKAMTKLSEDPNSLDNVVDAIFSIQSKSKSEDIKEFSESALIEEKVNLIYHATLAGIKEMRDGMKLLQSMVEDLKSMPGSDEKVRSGAILRALGRVNLRSYQSITRFVDYLSKVYEKADYAKKLSDAFKLKKEVRFLAGDKSKNVDLTTLAKTFLQIDPSLVDDIDAYLNMAKLIKDSIVGSKRKGDKHDFSPIVNILHASYSIRDILEAQDKKLQDMLAKEINDTLGIDTQGMTYDELKSLIVKEEKTDKYKNDTEVSSRTLMSRIFDINRSMINKMLNDEEDPFTGYPVWFTDGQKEIIKRFMDMDLKFLDSKEMLSAIDSLTNFIQNKSTAGMETVLAKYEARKNIEYLIRNGFVGKNLSKFFSKSFGRLLAEQFVPMQLLFERFFSGAMRGDKVMNMMGINGVIRGANLANTISNKVIDSYVAKFYDKKVNGEQFNTHRNDVERGMIAFMIRNVVGTDKEMKVEFEKRKNLILQTIDTLEDGSDQERELSKVYRYVYNKILLNSKNIDDVKQNSGALNVEAVQFWIDEWSKHYDEMADVAMNVFNKKLRRDINYTADRYRKLDDAESIDVDLDNIDSIFLFNSGTEFVSDPGRAGSLMEASTPTKLPNNRYVILSFDKNNADALSEALVDVKTASSIKQVSEFTKSKKYKSLFKSSDDASLLKRRVNNYILNVRDKNWAIRKDELSKFAQAINKLSRTGAAQALAGVFTPLKQTIPVFFNTLVNTNGKVFKNIVLNKDAEEFIANSGYGIANRGVMSQAQIESIDHLMKMAAQSKGEKAMRFVEKANELQLKYFLQKPDVFIAKASWISYYEQYLNNNGYNTKNIDYKTHKINKDAADYAEIMVNRQQNVSDHNLSGDLFTSKDPIRQLISKIVMPFASFRMNQSSRFANDLQIAFSKVATEEDKAIARKSLAGFSVEMAVYRGISALVSILLTNVIQELRGADEDDEDKKKRVYNIFKANASNVIGDILSPLPILDKVTQGAVYEILDITQSLLGVEEDEKINIYEPKASDYLQSFGMLGVTPERLYNLYQLSKLSATGKFENEYGEDRYIRPIDRSIMAKLIPLALASDAGLIPGVEIETIVRKEIKESQKSALKEDPKSLGSEYIKNEHELKALKEVRDNTLLTDEASANLNMEIEYLNNKISDNPSSRIEKKYKKWQDDAKEEKKKLLEGYKNISEMKKKNESLYDRNFGPKSEYGQGKLIDKKVKAIKKRDWGSED